MAQPIPALNISQRARRRIAWRLLPFLFILYIVAYLDRVNVAYAALEMQSALNFSDRVFGLGAGIFFLGYFLLQIPGALIVERWSARKWIGPIIICWGIVTILTAFIRTSGEFYAARFILGVAEAGFFPGVVVYLSHWFSEKDRAKAVAGFMCAIPVSQVIGAPIAGLLLGVNWLGLDGWCWLFILTGIPAVLFGIATIFYMTDWPHQAAWLPEDERSWISGELEREKERKLARVSYSIWKALRQREIVLLTLICFFFVTGEYAFMLWLPTILKRLSQAGGAAGLSNLSVSLLAAIPYVAALAAMLLNGWHSDKTGERRWHTAGPLFVGAGALLLVVIFGSNVFVAVALFTVVGACLNAKKPPFWAMPTLTLTKSAAAASIGFINSVGNLGGFVGPFVVGYLGTATHSFTGGLVFLQANVLIAAVLVLLLRVHRGAE